MEKTKIEKASSADLDQVLCLLRENGLPTAGVNELLPNLLIIREGRRIIGCAGLEVYGRTGLLRSVAVSQDRRNKGNGTLLTKAVLELAREKKDITGVDIDASSADIGASLTGRLAKLARYGIMFYNGAGYSHAENDKYKKIAANLHLLPLAGFSIVGYLDYEKQDKDKEALTYKLDSYVEMVKNLTLGLEYFVYRNDKNLTAEKNRYDVSGLSIFGRYSLQPDVLALFARFDRYEPNSRIEDDTVSLIIAGFDWAPVHKSMRIQPNVWIRTYADPEKENDIIFNLAFFLSF